VQDAVRAQQAVAIGYRDKHGLVHLGLESKQIVDLAPTERLVVVSYN